MSPGWNASVVASFLEAFGTISAVVVALFTQVYLVRRRRPHLTMDISMAPEDEDFVIIRSAAPDEECVEMWGRLRIHAEQGRRTAQGAQVRLVKALRPGDSSGKPVVPSGPMIWSSLGPQPQRILSGAWLRLDVLRYRIVRSGYARQLEVEVGYDFSPPDPQTVLDEPGEYTLIFVLGADDGDTTQWRFTFEHVPNAEANTDEDLRALIRNVKLVRIRSTAERRRWLLAFRPMTLPAARKALT